MWDLASFSIIRLAGSVIAEDVVGSLQCAVAHLHTPLVVVMGHEGCADITAVVDDMLNAAHEPSRIESLLQLIKLGLEQLNLRQERKQLLRAAVEAKVHWSIKELHRLPEA